MSCRCMKRRSRRSCLKTSQGEKKGAKFFLLALSLGKGSAYTPSSPLLSSPLYLIQMNAHTHNTRTHARTHALRDCSAHHTAAGFGYKTIQIFSRNHCRWPNTPNSPSGLSRVTQTRLILGGKGPRSARFGTSPKWSCWWHERVRSLIRWGKKKKSLQNRGGRVKHMTLMQFGYEYSPWVMALGRRGHDFTLHSRWFIKGKSSILSRLCPCRQLCGSWIQLSSFTTSFKYINNHLKLVLGSFTSQLLIWSHKDISLRHGKRFFLDSFMIENIIWRAAKQRRSRYIFIK